MAGRKRKPTQIRLLEGDPGHRPLNPNEPKPESGIPACPKHLSKRAKIVWRKLGRLLDDTGVITKDDGLALELLVEAYEDFRNAGDLLDDAAKEKLFEQLQTLERKDGMIYKSFTANGFILRAHPANALRAAAWKRTASMLTEFGLTPASRSKVSGSVAGDAEDPLEALIRRGAEAARGA